MKFLGVDFAKEIDKGFKAAGMGSNAISTVTLQKRAPGTATAGRLTAGNNPTFTAYAGLRGFMSDAKVGFMLSSDGAAGGYTLVITGDVMVNIFGNSLPQSGGLPSVVPVAGDIATINGKSYTIYHVDPGAPTGTLYSCTARA